LPEQRERHCETLKWLLIFITSAIKSKQLLEYSSLYLGFIALNMAQFSSSAAPADIICEEQIFGMSFHPQFDIVATGHVDGSVEVWNYSAASTGIENKRVLHLIDVFEDGCSCRGVVFQEDGQILHTISSDKSYQGFDVSGKSVFKIDNAHDDKLNKIIALEGMPGVYATGDDSGVVKIWDARAGTSTMQFNKHEDFVADMSYCTEKHTLMSVGGDAALCTYDLRKPANSFRSEDQEAELHCVMTMRGGRTVVCGTQEGVLLLFKWGRWEDCSDRFPGHPETIDCMVKVDENTLLTGSSDGLIRVVSVLPNKVLGVVGDHEPFPVEGMERNHNGRLLGSYAHDEKLRFWDLAILCDDDGDDEDEDEGGGGDVDMFDEEEVGGAASEDGGAIEMEGGSGDEDEDEEAEGIGQERVSRWAAEEAGGTMSASESDDSDSDGGGGGGGGGGGSSGFHIPSASERFFSDL